MPKKIVVTDHTFGTLVHAPALAAQASAEFEEHQVASEADTIVVTRGADVVLVQYAPITRSVLEVLAPGALVIRYGIGVDNIDVDAAAQLGIRVANVPDYGVDTVADHAVTLLLSALRKVFQYDRALRENRQWVEATVFAPIKALRDTTVGLVGTGRIGSAVAERLAVFGCTVIAFDPYADREALAARGIEPVELDDLLERADAVSLHAPLTPSTEHIIDASALAKMASTAVLVNTARGPLVDSVALAEALTSGSIAGAALDVTEPEPLPVDSPLWNAPNLSISPHVSFYSEASLDRLERLAAEEAERAVLGQPLRAELVSR